MFDWWLCFHAYLYSTLWHWSWCHVRIFMRLHHLLMKTVRFPLITRIVLMKTKMIFVLPFVSAVAADKQAWSSRSGILSIKQLCWIARIRRSISPKQIGRVNTSNAFSILPRFNWVYSWHFFAVKAFGTSQVLCYASGCLGHITLT